MEELGREVEDGIRGEDGVGVGVLGFGERCGW